MAKTIKPFRMGVLLAVLCASAPCRQVQKPKTPKLPVVEMLYPPGGSLLDRLCRDDFKVHIEDQAIQAAVQKLPEFQKQWDAEGPEYMNAALTEIGLDFPYQEMQATLTVCLPASTSIPLIVEVDKFLSTAKKPAPAWEFSEIVFHELMHTYVRPVLSRSALMKKYQNEAPATRYHLHVMAIEKMTLLKLNRPVDLKTMADEYRNGPDPAYKRAWEIVNSEGYQAFIEELQALRKPAV
jgi:hypothetical protein